MFKTRVFDASEVQKAKKYASNLWAGAVYQHSKTGMLYATNEHAEFTSNVFNPVK